MTRVGSQPYDQMQFLYYQSVHSLPKVKLKTFHGRAGHHCDTKKFSDRKAMVIQDYEVTRKLWDGRVPVQFVLDKLEFMQCSAKPFYIMVPRMSYFPLILPRVLQYFTTVMEHFEMDTVWLQYNCKPLKWHYPVGVLFDLLKTDDLLPWTIVLKTKDFPREVMPFKGNDLESSYIQSVKEADQLKHRARIVNSMKVDEHRQLWSSLLHDKFDEFWAVNKKLMEANEREPILHVPIRIYQIDCPFRQPLIKPYDESGRARTIADALKAINVEPQSPVISHGISVPSATPLIWMLQNLSYLDNFIHVIVLPTST